MPRRALFNEEEPDDADSCQTPAKRPRNDNGNRSDGVNSNARTQSSAGNADPKPAMPRLLTIEYKDEPAVAGVIKTITLKNFMCHANVKVDFHKNVTFIHGRNGSGKSAILAGLVLGLGGKPSALNRGNTVKEYIRTQCASGEISISFHNAGPEAYKPDIYGKTITIERAMFAAGRSSYKIKDERGTAVATRYDEVTSILRCYNFQLDNPIMILTQDTSRTFLSQCNPKKLYEMFYRGTQLQKMDEDFEVVLRNQHMLEDAVSRRRQIMKEVDEQLQDITDKIEAHAKAQSNRESLADLAKELVWAKWRDADKELTNYRTRLAALEQRASKLTNEIDAEKEGEISDDEKMATEKERLDGIKAALELLHQQMSHLHLQMEEANRRYREKKTKCEQFGKEIASYIKEKNESEACMRKIQEKEMNQERKQLRDQKELELQQARERRQKASSDDEKVKKECSHWENTMRGHKAQAQAKRPEIEHVTQNLNFARTQINHLQAAQSNTLARFGNYTPGLIRLIDQAVSAGHFHRRPRGPVGNCISLRDERYATAVEACIGGGFLCGYICHDFEDNKKLEELMNRAGCDQRSRPSIFIRNFGNEREMYDVSAAETRSEKYPNVLSVLNITDAVVRNLLIDQRRIETVVLFEEEQEMLEVMRNQPPMNASSAYDLQGGNALMHPTFRFYPAQGQGGARYLVKSLDQKLRYMQEQMQQFQEEKQRLENDLREVQRQIAEGEQQVHRCQNGIKQCQMQMADEDRRIRRLEQEIGDLLPANTDTHMLEEEIQETERKLAEANASLEEAEAALRQQSAVQAEIQDRVDEKKAEERTLMERSRNQEKLMDRLMRESANKKRNSQGKQKLLDDTNRDVENVLTNIEQQSAKVEQLLNEAKELQEEPIISESSCADIERNMRRLHTSISSFEQSADNLQELVELSKKKTMRLQTVKGLLEEIEATTTLLGEAVEARKAGYGHIKRLTGIMVKQRFVMNLSGRNYYGKLEIKDDDRMLTIYVEPRQVDQRQQLLQAQSGRGSVQRRVQDLRGLSGGERSYSTVAFILSLWETMNAPCCCLDEFDVFMDQCSRRMIMELLIHFAWKKRPSNQFIFLTPLSVSELPFHAKGLKVFELHPPRGNAVSASRQ